MERWNGAFEFHFIGHLQSRKVRQVLPCVTLIHSVDSISLVEELDRRAETEVRVLLEVNVGEEESKYGILPAAAETLLQRAAAYRRVEFRGAYGYGSPRRRPRSGKVLLPRSPRHFAIIWPLSSPTVTN